MRSPLEMNGTGALLRRYMWGPGVDEPIVWDEGGALELRRAGPGGDHPGAARRPRGLDSRLCRLLGEPDRRRCLRRARAPAAANAGRFGYTGQAWIPELGLWYYKARVYSPTLGRFLQTDPVGYKDQVNLYEYVGDDPVDGRDPSGDFIKDFGISKASWQIRHLFGDLGIRGFCWGGNLDGVAGSRTSALSQMLTGRRMNSATDAKEGMKARDRGGHRWGDSESARGSDHRQPLSKEPMRGSPRPEPGPHRRASQARLFGAQPGRCHLLCSTTRSQTASRR